MIKDLLIQLKEYTEEPDAFETQSERDMERELENKLDKDIQKAEKEKVKYIIQMICILDNIQKEVDFTYYHKHKNFYLEFDSKYQYNKFIARESKSKRFNDCIEYFPHKTFEKLSKDFSGSRFLLLRVK